MPLVTVEGPVIKDLDKKRVMVKKITEAAAKAFSFSKDDIVVIIKENLPENVGVGGELVSDLKKKKK